MFDDNDRRPMPGDSDYKGGVHYTTIYREGKSIRVRTVTDSNGFPVCVTEEPLFLGLF